MRAITNPKIEKQKDLIEKTKAKIVELLAKLREQEKHLRRLEDFEIVAQFRSELVSDEHYQDVKRSDWNENEQKEVTESETITEN